MSTQEQEPGTTRYVATVTRIYRNPDGTWRVDDVFAMNLVHAYELAPALKAFAKKVHESPPPVVLEGQESIL